MKHIFKIFLSILIMVHLMSCVIKTNETEIGVKIRKFTLFGKSGVQDEIYPPGRYHFYIPLFTEFQKFDTRLKTMDMTYDPRTGDSRYKDDLLFKTIDGNDISLDVIIQYRIIPEKAPHILKFVAQNDDELKYTIIRSIARSKPRDIFGELKTEEFYIAQAREEKSELVKESMNKILVPNGILIESVLTKDYRFNKAYQKAIEDKKVADQLAEKNKSSTAAAVEEYKRKIQEALGRVNQMTAKANGEFKKEKIEADAYLKKMQYLAKAIKVEGIKEAQGIKKMNAALAGSGGRTMVKLEIARAMQGKKIILLPLSAGGMNLKTTNVNDLINVYGIKALSGEGDKNAK